MHYSKHSTIVILLAASVLFCKCKKGWLEIKSQKSQTTPTTLSDYQAILDLTPIMNENEISIGEIAADGHYITDAIWNNSTYSISRNAYTWSNTFSYPFMTAWDATYNRVFICNVVLEGIQKIKTTSTEEKNQKNDIYGQALFNRAEAFWSLSQVFALPYNSVDQNQNMGIPLRLTSEIYEKSQRSSVKETYERIITDLKSAAELLQDKALVPTRGSRVAAYALLARTYLAMSRFDSSASYANKGLSIQNTLLDYNLVPESDGSIFGGSNFNPEVIFFSTMSMSEMDDYLFSNYLVDQLLFNLYDNADLRKTRFFQETDGIIRFKGNYHTSSYPLFCGISTDELYLIRAENYARIGLVNEAMKDLNDLLIKRWNENVIFKPKLANTAEEALNQILIERRKELILRNLRWSDIRRLNHEKDYAMTITRKIGGASFSIEPNSYKFTFPLPDNVLSKSGMPQTTGW